jgi:hypothetical protein
MRSSNHRRLSTCLVVVGSVVLVACAVSPAGMRSGPRAERTQTAPDKMRTNSTRITNAYDIVHTLRPWMLMTRDETPLKGHGISSPGGSRALRVYVDDISIGGIDALRTVPGDAVVFIQWLSAIDATTRYGRGHMGGVIAVTTGASRR